MALFFLLNVVKLNSGTRYPGESIDSTVDNVAAIQAAGGALVPQSDTLVAAAASAARAARVQGALPEVLAAIMIGGTAASNSQNNNSQNAFIDLALTDWREVDANNLVSNIAGNGGILASDTTPVLGGTSKQQSILWATGNADIISVARGVPLDWDVTSPARLELTVASGSTDAATMGVQIIYDNTAAVTYSADDTNTKSATQHKINATLPIGDMPATGPSSVGVMLTPPAHATNTITLWAARLFYKRKPLTS